MRFYRFILIPCHRRNPAVSIAREQLLRKSWKWLMNINSWLFPFTKMSFFYQLSEMTYNEYLQLTDWVLVKAALNIVMLFFTYCYCRYLRKILQFFRLAPTVSNSPSQVINAVFFECWSRSGQCLTSPTDTLISCSV